MEKKMAAFTKWKKERKRFLIRLAVFALIFYLGLPFCLTFLSEYMNGKCIGGIPLTWLYAFLQVLITWLLGWIYWRKSLLLDRLLTRAKEEGKT